MTTATAYIGLGSNLGEPLQQLGAAVIAIQQIRDTELIALSHLYLTEPLGDIEQPDFVNAAAKLRTKLSPSNLLTALQNIENQQGRIRERHWGPRTLDIDILLFGDLTLETPRLTLPHPHIEQRNFVLQPLADIDPGIVFPNGNNLNDALAIVGNKGLKHLMDSDTFIKTFINTCR